MSNKLCFIFFLLVGFLFNMGYSSAAIAYDEDTNDVVEIVDFDYDIEKMTEGQIIEYYDLDDFQRKFATIEKIEDNFTLITLEIVDIETKKPRNLVIRVEN